MRSDLREGRSLPAWMGRLTRDEQGGMTIWGLFLFAMLCAVGALGLDVTHLYAARTQLQVAADIAAHSALFTRNRGRDADDAKVAALEAVAVAMPEDPYGKVIETADIIFGRWEDPDGNGDWTFTEDADSKSAVLVTTERAQTSQNPVGSFLFRIVGRDDFDVRTEAVYSTYYYPCLSEGFAAEGRVDMQSNNSFYENFCIHSNTVVELNNGNFFDDGTVVSFPDGVSYYENKPGSIFAQNDGFREALRDGSYNLAELDRLRIGATLPTGVLPYKESITTRNHDDSPWFLESETPMPPMTGGTYGPSSFTAGRVNQISCGTSSSSGSRSSRIPAAEGDAGIVLAAGGNSGSGGNGGSGGTSGGGSSNQLTLSGNFSKMVIVTDCLVNLAQGTTFTDVILYTSSTDPRSITVPSEFTLGKDDGCAERGGATLLTMGGMHAAAQMRMFGGQVRMLGNLDFASGGNAGVTGQGVSVMTGGEIDGTTQMNISSCDTGMDRSFETTTFRLAR